MEKFSILRVAVIAGTLLLGLIFTRMRAKIIKTAQADSRVTKKRSRLYTILAAFFFWLSCGLVFGLFSGHEGALKVEMMAPRMNVFGWSLSSSVVIGWMAMLLVIALAVALRLFVIPKFQEKPKGVQALLEIAVSTVSDYTKEKSGVRSDALNAYILTVALFLTGCAVMELFSFRPPTADIVLTLSLALCTFVLINYYGIKKKGVGGRIGSFAKPTPIVFPFQILSNIAIPVSLACRLFGNMLGGMIVVHLVYMALGAFGVGIPAVLGLYFNVFHPLIQVFIFVTLSLTFIGEATE